MKSTLLTLLVAGWTGLSANPSGGINTAGNGGGFAEMLALSVDETLGAQIENCLRNGSFCDLDADQARFASELLDALQGLQVKPLRFEADCARPQISIETEAVTITSCALYDTEKEDAPRSLKEISVLVARARVAQWEKSSGLKGASLDAIFADFEMTDKASAISFGSERVVLHFVDFRKNWYDKETALILEAPAGSLDLTERLESGLCDGKYSHFSVEEVSVAIEKKYVNESGAFVFEGELRWQCGSIGAGGRFKARLLVSALLTSTLSVDVESVNLRVRQKETDF